MQKLLNEYVKNFCSTCKAKQCDKGIVFSQIKYMEGNTPKVAKSVKCVDYVKDESKIKGYVKPLKRTATVEHCLMPELWSRQ